jgi:hypothetical protein
MFTVNIRHSLNGYGIKSMNLHPEVWAQTNGTGGGDMSGGNTTGGNTSGGNTSGGETSGGNTSGGNTSDPAGDANNSSGLLWKSYSYNCTIAEKLVVTVACGSFTTNATYYSNTVTLRSQILACGGSYRYTVNEPGIKKYCFDGWSFCSPNTDCH